MVQIVLLILQNEKKDRDPGDRACCQIQWILWGCVWISDRNYLEKVENVLKGSDP